MHRYRRILSLLLLAILVGGCNWPFSYPTAQSAAAAETPAGTAVVDTAHLSPLTTPRQELKEARGTASPAPVVVLGRGGLFSGQIIRFDLPEGYRALEGVDGGCFLYHESLPGFLILYPVSGEPAETLATLLNATANTRRTETPLEVDLGGLTFVGLFVETEADDRLFLATSEDWALVAQGPVSDWDSLAVGLNRVLVSLTFEEVE